MRGVYQGPRPARPGDADSTVDGDGRDATRIPPFQTLEIPCLLHSLGSREDDPSHREIRGKAQGGRLHAALRADRPPQRAVSGRITVPCRHRVMDGTIRFGLGLGPAWALCAQSVHRRGQAPGSRSALSPWETLAYTSGDRKAAEMAWLCSIKIQLDRSVGRPLRVPAVDARHSVRRVLRYGRAGRAAQEKKKMRYPAVSPGPFMAKMQSDKATGRVHHGMVRKWPRPRPCHRRR